MNKALLTIVLFMSQAQGSVVLWDSQAHKSKETKPSIILKSSNPDYYTGAGMTFGRGYDNFTDESSGTCVDIIKTEYDGDREKETIQDNVFKLDLIESSYDLSKRLGISTSASLKSGFASGSQSTSYVDEQKMNQYSIYILVSAEVSTPQERSVQEDLNPFYAELARTNPKAFREKCGNEYVSTIQRGGLFYGILKLETNDTSSYTTLKTALRAHVGTFKASIDLENSIKEVLHDKAMQIFIHQVGGKDSNYPTSLKELVERVTQFPSEVTSNKVPLKAVTVPYTQLKSYPTEATAFDTSNQEEVLEYLSQLRFKITGQKNDITYIQYNQSQFESFSQEDISLRIDYLNKKLNDINKMTKKCLNNFDTCLMPENFDFINFKLPVRLTIAKVDDQCKMHVDEQCGIVYKMAEAERCGAASYNLGKGDVCGVKSYKSLRSSFCPVELYKMATGPECGVTSYNQGQDGNICGVTLSGSCTMSVPFEVFPKSFSGPLQGGSCFSHSNTCRDPRFGVEAYNSCRHPNFGVEQYLECDVKENGVAEYNECRDSKFGIEKYNVCPDLVHVEAIKKCLLKEVLDQETGIVKLINCTL